MFRLDFFVFSLALKLIAKTTFSYYYKGIYLLFSYLVDVEPVGPQVRHQQEPALTAQAGAVEPGAVRVGLVLQENKNRLCSSTCGIYKSFKCKKTLIA